MKSTPMMLVLVCTLVPAMTWADAAVIERAAAQKTGETWRFDVTVSHGDTGWDDYADGWRIESTGGAELGMRVLHHPHVNEQPFTRSLSGVSIPEGTDSVRIRVRTNVEGWSEDSFEISLP